jgi:ABC-type Zn uptake system ZnuABC Zn-binding protein ZnuA
MITKRHTTSHVRRLVVSCLALIAMICGPEAATAAGSHDGNQQAAHGHHRDREHHGRHDKAAHEGHHTNAPIRVVTTLSDYAWAASQIGGDLVQADAIARGNQDAHFVRPRPSYSMMLRDAELFVTTGLDLELWVPTLLDAAGNPKVLEGGTGYVAAWPGIEMLEVPTTLSRTEGDVHIYGNPHIHTEPLNMVAIARNILAGLQKADPANAATYQEREKALEERLYRRLFGDELVDLMGGETLARLARTGRLHSFLESKEYPAGSGRSLADRLGGWMKQTEPLRGRQIIGYHKNWIYFGERFGLDFVGYIEPKPGIPPTPRHVETIIDLIRNQGIKVILSANYFDPLKPQAIADRTGATVVIVPLSTGGEPGIDGYEKLIDTWIARLVEAFEESETG